MTTPDPFAHASLRQRVVFLAAAVKHRYARSAQHDPSGLELELAEKATQLALELEIAHHRMSEMYRTIGDALHHLDPVNPERASDMQGVLRAEAALTREFKAQQGAEVRARVGMDGSVHSAPWTPDDPFRAATAAGFGTRDCAHCGRVCGDRDGGMSVVNGQPLCHPNAEGRPDCYRMVTVYSHPLHNCNTCKANAPDPVDDRSMP